MFNPFYILTLLFDRKVEFEMQQRVMRTKDRSIALANISAVEVSRFPLTPLVLFFLVPGLMFLISALGSLFALNAVIGGQGAGAGGFTLMVVTSLIVPAVLIFLFFFFKKRRAYYLMIHTNNGAMTVFRNRSQAFITQVRDAIDDKINNDRADMTFHANFAEGSVRSLNVDRFEAENLAADMVVANSPGSHVANHSPGAQIGTGNQMSDNVFSTNYRPAAERVDHTGEKPWYEKMLDVPLEKTSDFLSGLKNAGPGTILTGDEISEPAGRDMASTDSNNAAFNSGLHARGKANGDAFETPEWANAGTQYAQARNEMLEKSPYAMNGSAGHMVANHSPGAQIGGHNSMSGNVILTDYRQHIPKVETIRRELTDPKITEKLDEMIALMKSGTPQPEEKRRLKDYAMELSTYVQAYPPITKIFQDIIQVIGV